MKFEMDGHTHDLLSGTMFCVTFVAVLWVVASCVVEQTKIQKGQPAHGIITNQAPSRLEDSP